MPPSLPSQGRVAAVSDSIAISVEKLEHHYGQRQAINSLDLQINRGQIFALLGPNGCGKTTLFRVLSTLIPIQQGNASLLGYDLRTQPDWVRRHLGVVFQAPSVDKKLTIAENMRYHGLIYGLAGKQLQDRCEAMRRRLGLADRAGDRTETLSGGLRRRVELAQGMLHQPQLLILDEPSTGLDPGARSDLWRYLAELRDQEGVTILLTTHLLDEAEKADQIAIMHQGVVAASGTAADLRASVGGDSITIRTPNPTQLANRIQEQFQVNADVLDGTVRMEQQEGHLWIPKVMELCADQIDAITLGKPTLEDVFIAKTGHRFWNE